MDADAVPAMKRAATLALALLATSPGCLTDDSDAESGGWAVQASQYGAAAFQPIADGDSLTVALGPQGADMVQVDLRVAVPPGGSQPGQVRIRGTSLMDAVVVGGWSQSGGDWQRATPGSDGRAAWVIKDFRIVFSADPCCFMCSHAGSISIEVGQAPALKRKVVFQRTGCPDSVACCYTKNTCPVAAAQCKYVESCPNPSSASLCGAPPPDGGGGASDMVGRDM